MQNNNNVSIMIEFMANNGELLTINLTPLCIKSSLTKSSYESRDQTENT